MLDPWACVLTEAFEHFHLVKVRIFSLPSKDLTAKPKSVSREAACMVQRY